MKWAVPAHRWLLTIFTLAVVVQFFLAGLGVFRVQKAGSVTDKQFGTDFDPHRTLGGILPIIALLVFLAALAARLGRNRVLVMLALPVLAELQFLFANTGPAWFRALHPVNAVVILGLAGSQTGRCWREHRTAPAG